MHAMNVWELEGIAPSILDPDTRWRKVVSLVARPLNTHSHLPSPISARYFGPRAGVDGEEKDL